MTQHVEWSLAFNRRVKKKHEIILRVSPKKGKKIFRCKYGDILDVVCIYSPRESAKNYREIEVLKLKRRIAAAATGIGRRRVAVETRRLSLKRTRRTNALYQSQKLSLSNNTCKRLLATDLHFSQLFLVTVKL